MKKKKILKRLSGIAAVAALAAALLTGTALAADDPGAGGSSGGGSASQEFGTFDEVTSYAGILIDGESITYAEDWDGTIIAHDGDITATGMTNVIIEAEEGNGVAISLASASDVFTINNCTISATSGTINDDLGYEAAAGVAIGVETGELWIVDSDISSSGSRSTPVYMFSSSGDEATSLVVVDSDITAYSDVVWVPAFKLIANGARATILMTNNDSWFYGSYILSNNWGAISQDSVDATTYVVNSTAISTEAGYGAYLTYGMEIYGSELYGGQYGIFMCGTSIVITDTGANVSEEAMSKVPDYEVEDLVTVIAAPFNAVVVHNSLQDTTMVAEGYFNNSILATDEAFFEYMVTAMSYDDDFLLDTTMDSYGVSSGAAYFYSRNLYGSIALVRSMNADFTFDNTQLYTSNGVLVQSVITYDPPSASGYLSVGEGEDVAGVNATFLNGDYTGDILHQDYQRSGSVTVGENATLTGKIVSGTYAAWLDLWSEENLTAALEEDGIDSSIFPSEDWAQDVYDNLTVEDDAEYADTDNLGVDVVVEAGGTWVVTEESTLASLTIEEGGSVTAPEGYTLVVYENCDTSNSLLTYENGTVVSVLSSGTTYTDVRIEVVAEETSEDGSGEGQDEDTNGGTDNDADVEGNNDGTGNDTDVEGNDDGTDNDADGDGTDNDTDAEGNDDGTDNDSDVDANNDGTGNDTDVEGNNDSTDNDADAEGNNDGTGNDTDVEGNNDSTDNDADAEGNNDSTDNDADAEGDNDSTDNGADVEGSNDSTDNDADSGDTSGSTGSDTSASTSSYDSLLVQANTLIAAAGDLTESNYTAESWETYQNALEALETLVNSETATEAELEAAIAAVNTALEGLEAADSTGTSTSTTSDDDSASPATGDENHIAAWIIIIIVVIIIIIILVVLMIVRKKKSSDQPAEEEDNGGSGYYPIDDNAGGSEEAGAPAAERFSKDSDSPEE